MKDSKTILNRHLWLSLSLQVLIIILIALPPLEPYRTKISEVTNLPSSAFWIPLLALLLGANILLFRHLSSHLVLPFQDLFKQTKLGSSSIAFKKKSMNTEEDHLKHFIESQTLRSSELEQEVARMESEVDRINELAKISPEEIDSLQTKLRAAAIEKDEFATKLVAEQTNAAKLEKEILSLRRDLKRTNRELESLQNEESSRSFEAQVPAASPLSSILVEKLKTPLSLINNLAWRLAKSWADTPPAKIREGLQEITRHSEEQLELLKRYESETRGSEERDAL
ncbi:hypothetical protein [Pelagicoccus mobilis]|uniref:Uncharacterized protein n=1 Tax=Pelagicoccus mobilis TaxID=415221 RepID=A0A934VLI3_9BACT|nr:hypothetical protein [Pelagicoccus mobilis]MBK1877776.1 hypothetical protein [Pelagicoccus mobilis]